MDAGAGEDVGVVDKVWSMSGTVHGAGTSCCLWPSREYGLVRTGKADEIAGDVGELSRISLIVVPYKGVPGVCEGEVRMADEAGSGGVEVEARPAT